MVFLTILFGGIPFLFILFLPTVEPQRSLTADESKELLELLRKQNRQTNGDRARYRIDLCPALPPWSLLWSSPSRCYWSLSTIRSRCRRKLSFYCRISMRNGRKL